MKKGKFAKRGHRGAANKTLALILSMVLIIGCVAGGTLAWLLDDTDAVVNTFTESDIEVGLKESENLDLQMIPGWTITKDPVAWVADGSVDSFLFVKIVESDNFDDFMTYKIADGWTELTEGSGIYYREVLEAAQGTEYPILEDDKVNVLGTVTKGDMEALTADTYPTLTFTAYAHQLYENNTTKFDAAEAWENLNS